MSRWLHAAALGVAASLMVPVAASAQSLADVAAREKERRSGKKAKSYSEDDLRRAGGSLSSFETSDDGSAPAEGATPADGSAPEGAATADAGSKEKAAEDQAAAERAWRQRLVAARDNILNVSSEIEGIQKSLTDNTGNYYSAARTSQLNRLEDLNKRLASAQESLESVRAEGRRNNYRE